jgi:hypothetical protein
MSASILAQIAQVWRGPPMPGPCTLCICCWRGCQNSNECETYSVYLCKCDRINVFGCQACLIQRLLD